MEYLICVDLEGVNNVKGLPYSGLVKGLEEYEIACEQAILEVNSAINALFDGGATCVYVWDTHANGTNLDFSKIDKRANKLESEKGCENRFVFAKAHNFVGAIFIGFHSKEGAINGVLSHTFNSSNIQYMKVGGKAYGEFEIDVTIASEYGIKPLFASGDSVFIEEVKMFSPATETVVTKKALGRNQAEFYDNEQVLKNIYDGVLKSMKKEIPLAVIPLPAEMEVRYTRVEYAKDIMDSKRQKFNKNFVYGEDAHIVKCYCETIEDLKYCL